MKFYAKLLLSGTHWHRMSSTLQRFLPTRIICTHDLKQLAGFGILIPVSISNLMYEGINSKEQEGLFQFSTLLCHSMKSLLFSFQYGS